MSIDSQSIEIRTKSVENILEPLIHQLSFLVGQSEITNRPKGLSKNGDCILILIKETIAEYVQKGNEIARDHPDIMHDFQIVLTDIQDTANHFYSAVSRFIDDPTNEEIQKNLSRPARSVLSSVTRLLILADLVDVHCLQAFLDKIRQDADRVIYAKDQKELSALTVSLYSNMSKLARLLKPRTQDLLDSVQRDDLALAQFSLRQSSSMLISATKANLNHPELATIGANKSYAVQIMHDSIDRVSNACDATYLPDVPPTLQGQAVMEIMEDILQTARSETEKVDFRNASHLHTALGQLSSEIYILTDSADLADHFQTTVKQSLHHLNEAVDELVEAWEFQSHNELRVLLDDISTACLNVRRIISKAALNLCSEVFISGDSPLLLLEQAAKEANENKLIVAVEQIQQQTTDAVDAALCLCSLSTNSGAVRFARFTATELEQLAPQLINASKALAMRKNSITVGENFVLFSASYKILLARLCTAVDDLTEVSDLIDVIDELLVKDIARCKSEALAGQIINLMRTSRTVSAKCSRVIEFILEDLSALDLDNPNLMQITSTISEIQETLIPKFTQIAKDMCRNIKAREPVQTDSVRETGAALQRAFSRMKQSLRTIFLDGLSPLPSRGENEKENEDHSFRENSDRLPSIVSSRQRTDLDHTSVSSSVLEAERMLAATFAFLESPAASIIDSSAEGRDTQTQSSSNQSLNGYQEHTSQSSGSDRLDQKIIELKLEKERFQREIELWETDEGCDIVSLAKQMCLLLVDMTDYARNVGTTCTDSRLIEAAHEISFLGGRLNRICIQIADQCPDSASKRDLLTYIKSVTLYSHQLGITSRVKADVKSLNGELGLDNALSLVQSAHNLISAVISTVKESHIASTRFASKRPVRKSIPSPSPSQWSLRKPDYNPLADSETSSQPECYPSFSFRFERSIEFNY